MFEYICKYMETHTINDYLAEVEEISKRLGLPYIEGNDPADNDEKERQTKLINEEFKKEIES